jgi:hypothetical protein
VPGARAHFQKKPRNPNPGGGCLCSPDGKLGDCVGPYIVGTHGEMLNAKNPYVVVGAGCAVRMAEKVAPPAAPAAETVAAAEVSVASALADASVSELAAALSAKVSGELPEAQ